jgi:hypothetical protein
MLRIIENRRGSVSCFVGNVHRNQFVQVGFTEVHCTESTYNTMRLVVSVVELETKPGTRVVKDFSIRRRVYKVVLIRNANPLQFNGLHFAFGEPSNNTEAVKCSYITIESDEVFSKL